MFLSRPSRIEGGLIITDVYVIDVNYSSEIAIAITVPILAAVVSKVEDNTESHSGVLPFELCRNFNCMLTYGN